MRVLVVADDLTGAGDAAAPFAATGALTELLLDPSAASAADVVALDLDVRDAGPDAAASRLHEAVNRWRDERRDVRFLKIDSTLRGPVGALVAAWRDAWREASSDGGDRPDVVLCPAFPARGRTVVGGRVHVDGVTVADLPEPAPGVRCPDAATDDDLRRIVREAPPRVLWAGAAGLAHALAASTTSAAPPVLPVASSAARRTTGGPLVVVGSRHPASRAQVGVLDPALVHRVRPEHLAGSCRDDHLLTALAAGRGVVVVLDPDAPAVHAGAGLAAALGAWCRPLAEQAGALVLTGGDTARGVLAAIGADRVRVLGEVEPGVVRSLLPDGRPVVTKSGAFGDPDTVARVLAEWADSAP